MERERETHTKAMNSARRRPGTDRERERGTKSERPWARAASESMHSAYQNFGKGVISLNKRLCISMGRAK